MNPENQMIWKVKFEYLIWDGIESIWLVWLDFTNETYIYLQCFKKRKEKVGAVWLPLIVVTPKSTGDVKVSSVVSVGVNIWWNHFSVNCGLTPLPLSQSCSLGINHHHHTHLGVYILYSIVIFHINDIYFKVWTSCFYPTMQLYIHCKR